MRCTKKYYNKNGIKKEFIIPLLEGKYLSNRLILITGGASGIGLSIADACLRNDADVIIAGRNEEKLKNAAKKLCLYGSQHIGILPLDICDIESFEKKIKRSRIYIRKED